MAEGQRKRSWMVPAVVVLFVVLFMAVVALLGGVWS
jgi:hypothetical protein